MVAASLRESPFCNLTGSSCLKCCEISPSQCSTVHLKRKRLLNTQMLRETRLLNSTVAVYINCLMDVIAKVWNNHLLLESCCCKNHPTGCSDPNLQQTTTQVSTQKGEEALVNSRATSDGHWWTPQRSGHCHVCHNACRLPTGS